MLVPFNTSGYPNGAVAACGNQASTLVLSQSSVASTHIVPVDGPSSNRGLGVEVVLRYTDESGHREYTVFGGMELIAPLYLSCSEHVH